MGRRGVSVEDETRWVFNRLAEDYHARPGYPEALVRRLMELAVPRGQVADLGAGTGHLALPLAHAGLNVAAVEPARAMLQKLEAEAPPNVRCIHAAAEHTGLEPKSFDLVLLADALHWVDPELTGKEAARLLRPGGACAVVEAHLADSPFLRELGLLLARYNPKARPAKADAARQLLSLATNGGEVARETFVHEVALEGPALEAVLRSLSYVGPALGRGALGELLAAVHRLAAEHGGAKWRRELLLTWAFAVTPGEGNGRHPV
ncbi:MAG: class I SAM-dependent methyltransferase [Myxococcota bacterium]